MNRVASKAVGSGSRLPEESPKGDSLRRLDGPPGRDIDLGLAILSAVTPRGVRRSQREIAAYCGCTVGNIYWIERRALHRLKRALFLRNDAELKELVEAVIGRPIGKDHS